MRNGGLKRLGWKACSAYDCLPESRSHEAANERLELEQVDVFISVLNAKGKSVLLTRGKGAKVGSAVTGPQTKQIRYRVLIPRTIPLKLRLAHNLANPVARYRIKVVARDPDGNKSTLVIPFAT